MNVPSAAFMLTLCVSASALIVMGAIKWRLPTSHRRQTSGVCRVVVCIHNISKARNVEGIVRSAAAFGAEEVVALGRKEKKRELASDPHLGEFGVVLRSLPDFAAVREHYAVAGEKGRCRRRVLVFGLEITPSAVEASDVWEAVMAGTDDNDEVVLVLVPGNEGTGLLSCERRHCDGYVMVRQTCAVAAGGGSGSLNVNTALAIVLHQLQ
eukprot:PhM_4_TR7787/c0_g1_i1/m.94488